ncbi:hypothetical protein EB796_009809 [Bugula neritina]|uniref:TMEM220 n=1 Tax=Bugula neritina TaxID=10212 RepID=A0A7J7K106_BUGNE|nr:hypothetical protein EB796_009809 [Bugula neritina]
MASEIGHRSFAPPKASLRLKTWRVCNAVMAVFTGICAVLQHNDPDPELWMPLYGLASLLCLAIATSPTFQGSIWWRVLVVLEMVYCLAIATYTIMYISEETRAIPHGPNPLHYEESREVLGILVVMFWLAGCLFYIPERLDESTSRQRETLVIILICSLSLLPLILWLICMVGVFSDSISYCRHMCSGNKG